MKRKRTFQKWFNEVVMIRLKKFWHIWAKALGEKAIAHDNTKSDAIAVIRTILVIINTTTCFFIIANTVRHW